MKDVAAANAWAAESAAATEVYNVGYGRRITVNELASKIIELTNSKSEIKHLPERPGDVKHSLAAVDALRGAGFEPSGEFDKGLAATIEFFKAKAS